MKKLNVKFKTVYISSVITLITTLLVWFAINVCLTKYELIGFIGSFMLSGFYFCLLFISTLLYIISLVLGIKNHKTLDNKSKIALFTMLIITSIIEFFFLFMIVL